MTEEELMSELGAKRVELMKLFPLDDALEAARLLMRVHFGSQFAERHGIFSPALESYIKNTYTPFMESLQDADEVYYYDAIGVLCGTAGYVSVRDGKINEKLIVVKS
jgi:hypothetical protein